MKASRQLPPLNQPCPRRHQQTQLPALGIDMKISPPWDWSQQRARAEGNAQIYLHTYPQARILRPFPPEVLKTATSMKIIASMFAAIILFID